MTSPKASAGKPEWRRFFRARLREIDASAAQTSAVCRHLGELLKTKSPTRIASFAALPGEPDLTALFEQYPTAHTWYFPRVVDDRLQFHQVTSLDQLHPGAFGVAEPHPDLPRVDPQALDLILCPGLGFAEDGIRLGRGKGFYDRFLAETRPDTLVIGVAFREQMSPKLPSSSHDRPMTHLATTEGIRKIPARD